MKKKLENVGRVLLFVCIISLCAYKANHREPAFRKSLQTEYDLSRQPGQTKPGSSSAKGPSSSKKPVAKAKPGAATPFKPADKIDPGEGEGLIAKSDCLACHKIQAKLVDPAYREVAQKYPLDEATVQTLADKVIKGGTGVWGQLPMTPHPQLSREDARKMVAYILSLKTK